MFESNCHFIYQLTSSFALVIISTAYTGIDHLDVNTSGTFKETYWTVSYLNPNQEPFSSTTKLFWCLHLNKPWTNCSFLASDLIPFELMCEGTNNVMLSTDLSDQEALPGLLLYRPRTSHSLFCRFVFCERLLASISLAKSCYKKNQTHKEPMNKDKRDILYQRDTLGWKRKS